VTESFTQDDLARVRRLVYHAACAAGLGSAIVDNLVVAVNEVAINAVRYAGGHGFLRVERAPEGLLVEIRDEGPGLPADLSDERPAPDALGGRGLWMARRLCGQLDIDSSPRGVTVRMFMPAS